MGLRIINTNNQNLEDLADRRWEDLEELAIKRNKMSKQEYLLKKAVIESRDEEEETQWNEIIEAIYDLDFEDLFNLQNLFLGKELPSIDEVHKQLEKLNKKE